MHSPARSCPALVLCHSAEAFQSSLGNEDMNDGEDLTRARVLPVLPQALGQGKEGAWLSCRLKQVLLSQHLRPQVFRGKLPLVQHQFDKKCEENYVYLGVSELGGFGLVTHTQKKIRICYIQ